jgi:hypothetical protein
VKLRRGIKAWTEYLAGHLEVGWCGVARGDARKWQRSAGGGRKTKLTPQAHLIERREGGGQLGRHESKGKTYFRKYAIDARVERLGPACGLWPMGEGRPARAGWAEGRVGRKVGRAESKKKEFLN